MLAYLLINCIPSQEKDVIKEISELPGVIEVNGILGRYYIIVKIKGDIPGELDLIVSEVRSIKGVTDSYTMTVVYGQGGSIDKESDSNVSLLEY